MMINRTKVQLTAGLWLLLCLCAAGCDASGGAGHTVSNPIVAHGSVQPDVQATPELNSLALFGSGLLAASAYVRRRRYLS